MTISITRRAALASIFAVAAPAVIRTPGLLMPVVPVPPALVHVGLAGDDVYGDGTALRPYASVQRAVAAMRRYGASVIDVELEAGHHIHPFGVDDLAEREVLNLSASQGTASSVASAGKDWTTELRITDRRAYYSWNKTQERAKLDEDERRAALRERKWQKELAYPC